MTSSADKFDKKMKKLIKADWTAKEVAAVSHRLNKRPFAAKVDYEVIEEEAALKVDRRSELINRVKAASEKELEGMLLVLDKILQAAKKERPVRRVHRRRVRNW